ncbi:hypothetical protein [Paludibaculum fermentans]|uniref:Uncharacterized protein n=1 Tax=Paludibaculum fermentans TaxID=1473598 RepID=A0A7S7NQU0_PALFE|nr:hypothetical protein [Paludibaculum fermentans]QOY88112.1 hypothetical protein IRI77_36150 [Paludibaculum fermentans]
MATDRAVRRYRAWYTALLRLYPRCFHDRFGEAMAQTFHDQCRERRNAGRSLLGLALWIFFETSAGIIRENTMHVTELRKTILRVALGALAFWMVPLVASQFVEDWHWGVGGFVFAYAMFFATGLAFALIARKMSAWSYKAGVALALASGFVMGWSTMVHISESENPANFVYFGVLAVGAIGVWLARLEARGMARATFAMAATLAVIAAFALLRSSGAPSSGPVWDVGVAHGGFVLLFAASGLLFRRASLAELK